MSDNRQPKLPGVPANPSTDDGLGIPELTSKDEIRRVLARKLDPKVPPDKREETIEWFMQAVEEYHSGPLPPPEQLAKYDLVSPGAARDIIDMAKKDQEHAVTQDKQFLRYQVSLSRMGMTFGFLIALAMVAGSVFLGAIGQPVLAGFLLTATMIGMVVAFLKAGDRLGRSTTPTNEEQPKPVATSTRRERRAAAKQKQR